MTELTFLFFVFGIPCEFRGILQPPHGLESEESDVAFFTAQGAQQAPTHAPRSHIQNVYQTVLDD